MGWLILYQSELDVPQDITLLRGHAPSRVCWYYTQKRNGERGEPNAQEQEYGALNERDLCKVNGMLKKS